jgi:hypothetical protein
MKTRKHKFPGQTDRPDLHESCLTFFLPDCYGRLWICSRSCASIFSALAGYTAGRGLHPAPKVEYSIAGIISLQGMGVKPGDRVFLKSGFGEFAGSFAARKLPNSSFLRHMPLAFGRFRRESDNCYFRAFGH